MPAWIGICGACGSGKDVLAEGIVKAYHAVQRDAIIMALADPVRNIAEEIYGQQNFLFHSRQGKEDPRESLDGHSPREILQEIGTRLRGFDSRIWINHLERRVARRDGMDEAIVLPAIRFPNEVEWLAGKKRSLLVYAKRDGKEGQHVREHDSERHWRNFSADLVYHAQERGSRKEAVEKAFQWFVSTSTFPL